MSMWCCGNNPQTHKTSLLILLSLYPLSDRYCTYISLQLGNGSPYTVLATVIDDEFLVIKGEEKLNRYLPTPYLHRYHCKICGTFVVSEVSSTKLKTFSLGLITWENNQIDDGWKPTYHQWYSNRLFDLNDTLPKYHIYESDQVDEIPNSYNGTYVHRDENSLRPSLNLILNNFTFSLTVKWAIPTDFTFKEIQYFGDIKKGMDGQMMLECLESQLNEGGCEKCVKNIEIEIEDQTATLRTHGKFGKLCSISLDHYTLYNVKSTH